VTVWRACHAYELLFDILIVRLARLFETAKHPVGLVKSPLNLGGIRPVNAVMAL
jgi:hypothetical protein